VFCLVQRHVRLLVLLPRHRIHPHYRVRNRVYYIPIHLFLFFFTPLRHLWPGGHLGTREVELNDPVFNVVVVDATPEAPDCGDDQEEEEELEQQQDKDDRKLQIERAESPVEKLDFLLQVGREAVGACEFFGQTRIYLQSLLQFKSEGACGGQYHQHRHRQEPVQQDLNPVV